MSEGQRFSFGGRVFDAEDQRLQELLAAIRESSTRLRCMCVPGGVEMYVAFHRQYIVKRMPDSGPRHHPGCPSFEPGPASSGLGELMGDAVVRLDGERFELHVGFAWTQSSNRTAVRGDPADVAEVSRPKRRMSLRALTHFLFERAGFNRWSPAMAGKRGQGVLHRHLVLAAEDIRVKGQSLAERLYVPEPFSVERKVELAGRRRERLAILQPRDDSHPMALVIGELKACESLAGGQRIWVRHMPDAPLVAEPQTWRRIERGFASLFEARDADGGQGLRLLLAALIRARREDTYEVELASLMLASENWIPLEGVHEAPLVRALVAQGRRFIKPMRYDARSACAFANVLLLDAGIHPVALHVVSPFMKQRDRALKDRQLDASGSGAWVWSLDGPMPELPEQIPVRH
ncbi:DUF1173 family protein [Aquabacterium humicola]|uniref:DUF1173 family protein n=1 Tax=Aquabacterium humicola TaxID=3237377 RepID=UPI002542DC98|nr:DUF1173 family protein [Rubrivivax pictus]